MKLLLDTHAWLWQVGDSARLSRRARAALDDDAAELYLSPLSVWEVGMLAAKRRIALETDIRGWVASALDGSPVTMAELTHDVALASFDLPDSVGRDPVDRLLVATCVVHDLAMLTADRRIRAYPGIRTIW